jgi:hypothetical protein
VSAGLFFATIAFMVFFLFTQTDQDNPQQRKRERDGLYRVCGILMAICAVCILVTITFLSHVSWLQSNYLVFVFESAAIVLFIIAWFAKGQVFLRDEGNGWSSLSEVWTYLCNILPDAIQSFLTIFSSKVSSDENGTKNPPASMESSHTSRTIPRPSSDGQNKQENSLAEEKVDVRDGSTSTASVSGVPSSEQLRFEPRESDYT